MSMCSSLNHNRCVDVWSATLSAPRSEEGPWRLTERAEFNFTVKESADGTPSIAAEPMEGYVREEMRLRPTANPEDRMAGQDRQRRNPNRAILAAFTARSKSTWFGQ